MTVCTPWIDETDLETCGLSLSGVDPDVTDLAIDAASEILFQFTAQQYPGTCTERLRPCSNSGNPLGFNWLLWSYPWVPMRIGGRWLNLGPCGCHVAADCGCGTYPRLNLGRTDVQSVETVNVDGVALDPADYRLDSGQFLVRLDGSWPCCQNLGENVDQPGTWYVDLTYGAPIPADLRRAAAVLATEFVNACTGAECRLPARTQTITRQGVTIGFLDPFDFLNSGRTGLVEVDLAIQAHNPHGLARPSGVWSPELGGRGVRSAVPGP